MQKTWVWTLGQEHPLEKGMATQSIYLPREFHGQRRLAGYSPWGHKELDMTGYLEGKGWILDSFHKRFIT